ncbi:MAG: hypothetical protein P1V20_02520 [Verrucomicrobiales bacterium]|nr:hypothetical protein [Verrucomicrobiales bacterium]
MSDYPFKPPAKNPFSAAPKANPEPENRVEQVVVAQKPSRIAKPTEPLPALTMEERSCRTCEYFAFDEKEERHDAYKGECRRHAPSPGEEAEACWPVVPWKSWCGEWENGVSNEDMVRMARDIGESIAKDDF